MTGKFHLDWGEFGGFKSKEVLKYEVAMMALYGVGASVDDHMHPDDDLVYGGSRVKVNGLGSQGRCTMIHQPDENRYCINMAYVLLIP